MAADGEGGAIVFSDSDRVDFGGTSLPGGQVLARLDAEGVPIVVEHIAAGCCAEDIVVAPSGALYVAGTSVVPVAAGTAVAGCVARQRCSYVVRFSPDGSTEWGRGVVGDRRFRALAIDAAENVYVVGGFSMPVDFGAGDVVSAGSRDILLASYDPAGNLRWAETFGGVNADEAVAVAVASDSVTIAGHFSSHMLSVGGPPLGNPSEVAQPFLASFDRMDASHRRSRAFLTTENSGAMGLAVDGAGNILVAGEFRADLDLGGAVLTIPTGDWQDVFVGKLDSAWAPIWSRSFGNDVGEIGDYYAAMALDRDGRVYLAGGFSFEIDFGDGPVSGAFQDAFFAVQAPDGTPIWHAIWRGSRLYTGHEATDLAVDEEGNAFLIAKLHTLDFGVLAPSHSDYLIKFVQ